MRVRVLTHVTFQTSTEVLNLGPLNGVSEVQANVSRDEGRRIVLIQSKDERLADDVLEVPYENIRSMRLKYREYDDPEVAEPVLAKKGKK